MDRSMTDQAEQTGGPEDQAKVPADQSTLQLLRSISNDTVTLVRKEVELARQEIVEALSARAKAAAALATVGLLGLFILGFLGLAAASALDNVVRPWASRLIVAGGFMLIAGGAAMFGMGRMKRPSMVPEETKRTVKEDVEWARAQLKR
jgi:Putative Actinobacterial Holin-X, holin superfamily III